MNARDYQRQDAIQNAYFFFDAVEDEARRMLTAIEDYRNQFDEIIGTDTPPDEQIGRPEDRIEWAVMRARQFNCNAELAVRAAIKVARLTRG